MDTTPHPSLFTRRLQQLFTERLNPGTGRPFSDEHVGSAIGMSKAAVWNLRTGRADNPSLTTIARLAAFFGVVPGWFFTDPGRSPDPATPAADPDAELRVLLADAGVRNIAARASQLSDAGRQTIEDILDAISRRERGE